MRVISLTMRRLEPLLAGLVAHERDSFFVHSGTPRYFIDSVPQGMPVENWMVEISASDSPEAKKLTFED